MTASLKRIQETKLVVFTDVTSYDTIDSWLRRSKNSLKKVADGKDSTEKGVTQCDTLLDRINKSAISSLHAQGDHGDVRKLLPRCKTASILFKKIQCWHDSKKIKIAISDKKITLKNLKILLKKTREHQSSEQTAKLEQQVKDFDQWYKDYAEFYMSDNALHRQIQEGVKTQESLMAKYNKIMARRKEIKLKLEEGDTRMLNKVLKWAGAVIDCRAMLKTRQKTS